MKDFKGKLAVITGGASGVGRALGEALGHEGMRIVLTDVEEGALATTVDALRANGIDAHGRVCDVTSFEDVEAAAAAITEAHGNVHVLCNNAGVGAHEDVPMWDLPLNDWRWTMEVNVWGVIHGIKAFVPGMMAHGEEGHVVNTSSGNGGLILVPTTPIYSTSKAAVSALTEQLHLQLSMQGSSIHAHVLYPGPHIVSSNIFDARRNRPERFEREIEQVQEPITLETLDQMFEAMGRKLHTTTPEEVAEHAVTGLRDDSFFILPWNDDGEQRFRERMNCVLERRNPEPRLL